MESAPSVKVAVPRRRAKSWKQSVRSLRTKSAMVSGLSDERRRLVSALSNTFRSADGDPQALRRLYRRLEALLTDAYAAGEVPTLSYVRAVQAMAESRESGCAAGRRVAAALPIGLTERMEKALADGASKIAEG